MASQLEKARHFHALHRRSDAFIVPNPWDAGTARLLASVGFEALATTSLGLANMLGQVHVSCEDILENCRAIVAATDLPVTADLENGGGAAPDLVARTVRRACEVGAVGGSIEDATGDPADPIYSFALAVDRVRAAAEMARSLPVPFVLTARADNFLVGRNDLNDTIRRLQAFEEAGADVLYAPGLRDFETIRFVVSSVSKPVNVSMSKADKSLTVTDLANVGVKRISTGGMMSQLALATFLEAARDMKQEGSFSILQAAAPADELRTRFRKGQARDS